MMGGTINYVYWKGARLTPWMLYQLQRLDADLYRDWGLRLNVESAIRLHEEQRQIFFDRYTTNPNGRYIYPLNGRPDKRWYLGNWWYRIKDGGTVAAPGESNHEIRGQNAAVDISDTGDANGITKKNSARGRWLRSRLHLYDMDAEGDGFGEGWHFRVRGIFRTPPGTPSGGNSKPFTPDLSEEDEMLMLKIVAGKGQHLAALGIGVFKHFKKGEPYEKVMKVTRARDDWQTIDISELPTFLATYGCDRNIWDFRNAQGKSVPMDTPGAQFVVLDPLTKKVASGNTWSAVGALRAG